jgi:hypothetical protein
MRRNITKMSMKGRENNENKRITEEKVVGRKIEMNIQMGKKVR